MTHTVHDVHAAAAHVASHTDPKAKATALFDTVLGQIRHSIEEARAKGTVAEAVKVFEDNADHYRANRDAIIERLSS